MDIVDDARDLSRLNPDDVETISNCIKGLLERADAAKNMGSASTSLRSNMGQPLAGLKDPSVNWKDAISDALVSIDFTDFFDQSSRSSMCQALHQHKQLSGLVPCFDLMCGQPNRCCFIDHDGNAAFPGAKFRACLNEAFLVSVHVQVCIANIASDLLETVALADDVQ